MTQPRPVALNDVADLIRLLKDDSIASLLNEAGVLGDCGTRCDCNDSKCGCRGTVTSLANEQLSPAELEFMKQQRISQLRRQIQEFEQQIAAVAPVGPPGPGG